MKKRNFSIVKILIVLIGVAFSPLTALAGSLDSPAAPTSAGSAMYTLEDIYNRLNAGTAGAKRTGAFTEPASAPGASGRTQDEIMGKAPVADNTNGCVVGEVANGKTFWGLRTDGTWGPQTGTQATQTLSDLSATLTAGIYTATTLDAVDTDLASANIKSTVTIFGVAGKTEVVDTTTGDAVEGEIANGKKAWVDGVEVIGNIAAGSNVTGTNGNLSITITDGLYSGSKTATAQDTALAAGNIKTGVNIFGTTGSVIQASGNAVAGDVLSGKTYSGSSGAGTGNMPDKAGDNASTAQSAAGGVNKFTAPTGFYDGTNDTVTATDAQVAALNADLATGNIHAGKTIFGIAGKTEVVDTTSGDAVEGDILSGKKAWVAGTEVIGSASIATYPAPVEKTGAKAIGGYTADANEDITLQKGVAWPNPRFTDNTYGTVTDNLTGLIWLKNANCAAATRNWATALTDVASLNSAGTMNGNPCGDTSNGVSHQIDWRLPNVKEMQSLIDFAYISPALSNAAGTAQWTSSGDAFTGVQAGNYWSSTTNSGSTAFAWIVNLSNGGVSYGNEAFTYYVWPVRGGQ